MARVVHGLRQAEVAARAGLCTATLSDIERGWRRPNPREVVRILYAMCTDRGHVDSQEQE